MDALVMQFDELPKKKKKKLLSDKTFMAMLVRAAEGLLDVESITKEDSGTSTTSPSPDTDDYT